MRSSATVHGWVSRHIWSTYLGGIARQREHLPHVTAWFRVMSVSTTLVRLSVCNVHQWTGTLPYSTQLMQCVGVWQRPVSTHRIREISRGSAFRGSRPPGAVQPSHDGVTLPARTGEGTYRCCRPSHLARRSSAPSRGRLPTCTACGNGLPHAEAAGQPYTSKSYAAHLAAPLPLTSRVSLLGRGCPIPLVPLVPVAPRGLSAHCLVQGYMFGYNGGLAHIGRGGG